MNFSWRGFWDGSRVGARRSYHGLWRDAQATKDAAVIDLVEAQRVELGKKIGELDAEAARKNREIEELVGKVPF